MGIDSVLGSVEGLAVMSSAPDKPSVAKEAGAQPAKPAKVIKRYSNRKLYDTERSRYVTLEEIARMIKEGEEVQIVDNKSGRDLTAITLTQIIYEEEKQKSRMPLSMLRNLIQASGETLQDFWDRSVITPVVEVRTTAQKGVEELRHGALTLRDAATRNIADFTETAKTVFTKTGSQDASRTVEGLVHRFDDAFADARHRIERHMAKNRGEGIEMLSSLERHLRSRLEDLEALRSAEPNVAPSEPPSESED